MDRQPIHCDFFGIINPKYTDMNHWINFVLANGETEKWSFTKNNDNAIPQVGERIAVISTDNIKHTVCVAGAEHTKTFRKDCVYAIVEVVTPIQKHQEKLKPIVSDDMDRKARHAKNDHVGVRLVENLWGNTQRGKEWYAFYMNGRKRSQLEGPRQATFKKL